MANQSNFSTKCNREQTSDEDREVCYRWIKNGLSEERVSFPYDQLDSLQLLIPNDPICKVSTFIKYRKGRNGKLGLLDVKHAMLVIHTNGLDAYLTDRIDRCVLLKRLPKEEINSYLDLRQYVLTKSTFLNNSDVVMHDFIDVLMNKNSKLVRTQCSLWNNCIMYVRAVEKGLVKKMRIAGVQNHNIKDFSISSTDQENISSTINPGDEGRCYQKLTHADPTSDEVINNFWESLMAEA